jgi:transposase
MKPLSSDLRERVLNAVDRTEGSRRQLAARFDVNVSTITRWLHLRRQTGSSQPRPHGGDVAPTLDQDGLDRLRRLVVEDPDATLEVLKQRLGLGGSIMLVWRALRKLGITVKKKSPPAAERDRPEVKQKRREFRQDVARIEPGRLVFADEAGVTTAMTPRYGRASRGERVGDSTLASWESVTVIAAPGADGVRAPLALPGAVHAANFRAYVAVELVPALRPGDVVVFDDLAAHHSEEVREAIESAGARVLPLPPYSPDYSPIGEMFSKFKNFLRRIGARAKEHLYDAIGAGLRYVSDQDILGWFCHAGLCVAQT